MFLPAPSSHIIYFVNNRKQQTKQLRYIRRTHTIPTSSSSYHHHHIIITIVVVLLLLLIVVVQKIFRTSIQLTSLNPTMRRTDRQRCDESRHRHVVILSPHHTITSSVADAITRKNDHEHVSNCKLCNTRTCVNSLGHVKKEEEKKYFSSSSFSSLSSSALDREKIFPNIRLSVFNGFPILLTSSNVVERVVGSDGCGSALACAFLPSGSIWMVFYRYLRHPRPMFRSRI